MTDEKPRDVPPWLRRQCFEEETGKTYYAAIPWVASCRPDAWKELDDWLRWRSELAEALGLVPREAVAAELRAQAEAMEPKYEVHTIAPVDHWALAFEAGNSEGWHAARTELAGQLRARADELDPPTDGG